ncbi:hypothetical protein ACJX0J_038487, partial [Zea mays]
MKPILDQILNFFATIRCVVVLTVQINLLFDGYNLSIEMKRYGRFRNSYLHNLHQWIGLPFDFNFIVLDPILNILSFNKHTHKHWFARKGCLYVIIEISTGACLTWKAALTSMHLSLEGQQEHYVRCLYIGMWIYRFLAFSRMLNLLISNLTKGDMCFCCISYIVSNISHHKLICIVKATNLLFHMGLYVSSTCINNLFLIYYTSRTGNTRIT